MSKRYAPIKQPDGTTCYSGPNCRRHGKFNTTHTGKAQKTLPQPPEALTRPVNLVDHLPAPRTVRRGLNSPGNPLLEYLNQQAANKPEFARDEKDTLTKYSFIGSRYINPYLFNGEEGLRARAEYEMGDRLEGEAREQYLTKEIQLLKELAEQDIALLDSAQKKIHQTGTPKTLYRGFYLPKKYQGTVEEYVKENFTKNDTWVGESYLSTSYDSDLMLLMSAKDPKRFFVIEIAAITDGILLHRKPRHESDVSIQNAEKEMLLPHGLKFNVHDITKGTYETSYESDMVKRFLLTKKRPPTRKSFTVVQLTETQ